MNLGVETTRQLIAESPVLSVSAFSDESWGGDLVYFWLPDHSVEKFQHSLMNLGVETLIYPQSRALQCKFQHSLMNLGVETRQFRKA